MPLSGRSPRATANNVEAAARASRPFSSVCTVGRFDRQPPAQAPCSTTEAADHLHHHGRLQSRRRAFRFDLRAFGGVVASPPERVELRARRVLGPSHGRALGHPERGVRLHPRIVRQGHSFGCRPGAAGRQAAAYRQAADRAPRVADTCLRRRRAQPSRGSGLISRGCGRACLHFIGQFLTDGARSRSGQTSRPCPRPRAMRHQCSERENRQTSRRETIRRFGQGRSRRIGFQRAHRRLWRQWRAACAG